MITGKPKIIVIDKCYHGSVDETFATLDKDGNTVKREGNLGAPVDLDQTTRVVEFNDLAGMEAVAFLDAYLYDGLVHISKSAAGDARAVAGNRVLPLFSSFPWICDDLSV